MKKLTKFGTWLMGMFIVSVLFPINTEAQKTTKLTDPQIASVAVTANQIDINYAEIAMKKSTNKEVLQFAKTMKTDHASVIDMAVKLAKKLGVTPETNAITKSLLAGEVKTTKALKAAKAGHAFDKAYIDNEVTYHEAVIKTVETVLIPQSQNAELKGLLEKVLPTLKTHLEHAKMAQKDIK